MNAELYVRLSILEGYAGVKPGTWANAPNGIQDAMAHYGGLHPSWFAASDGSLLAQFVAGARSIPLGDARLPEADIDELRGDFLVGGAYRVGTGLLARCRTTHMQNRTGLNGARRVCFMQGRQRAIDRCRSITRRAAPLTPMADAAGIASEGSFPMQVPEAVFAWVDQVVGEDGVLTPGELRVYRSWREAPDKTATEIAEDLGVSTTYVARALRRVVEVVKNADRAPIFGVEAAVEVLAA